MATVEFRNSTDTNLYDINNNNITDVSTTAVSFTGSPGAMLLDTNTNSLDIGTVATGVSGECDVPAVGAATYVAFKLSDNLSLALTKVP